MSSSSENSDSDSGANFKRGKRKRPESPKRSLEKSRRDTRRSRTPQSSRRDDKREKDHRRYEKPRDDRRSNTEQKVHHTNERERSKDHHKNDSRSQEKHPRPAEHHNNPRKEGSHSSKSSSGQPRESPAETKRHSPSPVMAYGPTLPPPRVETVPEKPPRGVLGPTLPKDFVPNPNYAEVIDLNDSDDGETFGPALPSSSGALSERDLEMERRKIELKLRQLDKRDDALSNADQREEWMLELPEIRKVTDLGLGARQFRKNNRPDFSDRSDWTKTPNEGESDKKHREKKDLKKEEEESRQTKETKRRDEEQEKIAKAHKKSHKRDKSLMDIHEKKLKKEKKKQKEEKKQERRPFDRDTDLSANSFDEARKKSAIKKAQLLDTRFGSGSQRFL